MKHVQSFAEIESEFLARVHKIVWCIVATTDTRYRPRARVLHPIWEGSTGWILTRRHSHKAKHLAHNPYVSLIYMESPAYQIYADCRTEWVEEIAAKQRIWDMFKSVPEPLGYDPAPLFGSVEDAGTGLLKLTPWRIELADFLNERQVWHAADVAHT